LGYSLKVAVLDVPAHGPRRYVEGPCCYLGSDPPRMRGILVVSCRTLSACMVLSHAGDTRPSRPAVQALTSKPRGSRGHLGAYHRIYKKVHRAMTPERKEKESAPTPLNA
jgi:hypothetical protein